MSFLKVIGQSIISAPDKPKYDVIDKAEGYEERRYKTAKWVSTTVKSVSHDEARNVGVKRLFKYITGENENGSTVAMTSPVVTKVIPRDSSDTEGTFVVSFFIPMAHQENPYKPKSPEISIEEFPEISVYITTFGGYAKDVHFEEAKATLSGLLKDKNFDAETYYTAGYDSPMKFFNRTNELWLIKQDG